MTLSCGPEQTGVSIGGRDTPTFTLYGEDRLRIFEVLEVDPRNPTGDSLVRVWTVTKNPDGVPLKELHKITYGSVPQGYVQTLPESGPPPPLNPQRRYECWLHVVGKDLPRSTAFHYSDGRWRYYEPE